jgi:ATP-binding cassette subfamily C protein CydC
MKHVTVANPFGEHDGPVARLTVDAGSLDSVFPLGLGPLATATLAGALVTALLFLFLPSAGALFALLYAAGLFLVPAGLVLLGRSLGRMSVDRSAQRACLATAARRRQAWIGAAGAAAIQVLAALAVLAVLWQGLEALGAGTVSGPVLAVLLLACLGSFAAMTAARPAARSSPARS